jgi:Ca2+-binding RTX toxin-like protein
MRPAVLIGIALSLAWAPAARAAATCSLDPATATLTVEVDGSASLSAVKSTGTIRLDGASCDGATLTTVDTILVNGGAQADTLALNGRFAPGLTPEVDGSSEIEIAIALGGDEDTVVAFPIRGRLFMTGGGIDFDHDGDEDIHFGGTEILSIQGSAADDLVDASAYAPPAGGHVVIETHDGNDRVFGSAGNDWIYGGPGDDVARGNGGNDRFYGNAGVDTLFGGPGNDWFYADAVWQDGADSMQGDDGVDTVDYHMRYEGVTVTVGNGLADDGGPGEGDAVAPDIENVRGGHGDDVLTGSDARNEILGNDGDDQIDGGAGADVVDGGNGSDWLRGGAGNDIMHNADGFADLVDCGAALMDDAEPDPLDTISHCEL